MLEVDQETGNIHLSSLEPGEGTLVITFNQFGILYASNPIEVKLNPPVNKVPPKFESPPAVMNVKVTSPLPADPLETVSYTFPKLISENNVPILPLTIKDYENLKSFLTLEELKLTVDPNKLPKDIVTKGFIALDLELKDA